jgi:branched-subunit amino acid ABC-type transport system permease component
MAPNAVIDTFVIVIIGGMGSFLGSALAAVLVGFVQVFGTYYFPDLALALMYLLMLLVLVVRPGGLLGKEA